MKILITGGSGFIGSAICFYLKKKYPAYSIVAFDNLRRRGSELNIETLKRQGISFIHGDIRNTEDIRAAGEFNLLIEASAEPSVLAGLNSDPSYVIQNNLYGSVNCFNACVRNHANLIFLSTSRVYPIERIENANIREDETRYSFVRNQTENGISENGISEDLNLEGYRSFYGTTKLSSELLIREYEAFYGIKSAVTRFGVVAGPGQMGKSDQGIATLWLARHYWRQSLQYIGFGGTGKQVRDLLHIDDLLELIDIQVHNVDKFTGRVFNAGGGNSISASLMEMTELCEKITGNKIPIAKEISPRKADLPIYITDNSKITHDTGWKPGRNVEKIFTDIFLWIRQNEEKLKPVLS